MDYFLGFRHSWPKDIRRSLVLPKVDRVACCAWADSSGFIHGSRCRDSHSLGFQWAWEKLPYFLFSYDLNIEIGELKIIYAFFPDWLRNFHATKLKRLSAHYKFVADHLRQMELPFYPAVAGCFVMIDFRKVSLVSCHQEHVCDILVFAADKLLFCIFFSKIHRISMQLSCSFVLLPH